MATAKKKTVKKQVVKKAAKKNTASKKTTRKPVKKAIKKTLKKRSADNSRIKVNLEQRHKMICEAAYYISLEKTYETVNPTEDWLQAEAFIDKICTVHNK
jgi:hypothetical protein